MKKMFFRVCNPETEQGLWYDFKGNFTGFIHERFDFCTHNKLEMPFDEELVGYLSATDSLDDLYNWFSKKDILKLQKHGWFIHVYESEDYKYYEKFNHLVISQENSKLVKKLILNELNFSTLIIFLGCSENLSYILVLTSNVTVFLPFANFSNKVSAPATIAK